MRRFFLSLVVVGLSACGGPPPSPGTPEEGQCAENFAGCTELEDRTADDASRTIAFGDTLGNTYAPKCLKIKAGQTVTFDGDFTVHPLAHACGPAETIPNVTTGTSEAVTFETSGNYGYFCTRHGNPAGGGMAGRIVVE